MRNPLRSEGEAFNFLIVVIGAAVAVVIASLINRWLGLAVAILALGAVGWWIAGNRSEEAPPRIASQVPHDEEERRILVLANETVGGGALRDCIRSRAEGVAENVLVVAPALNSQLRHWASDEDGAREAARARVEASVARLREAGINVHGDVGDGEPLQALEDAVRTFGPDEVIISTHPEGRSHWLETGLVDTARERFAVPITHVVVHDAATSREEVL
jgi:hypothetical protein